VNRAAHTPSLTDREFQLFQELIHREAGIFLPDAKRALLIARLSKRVRVLGFDSFGDYYEHVLTDLSGERTTMLDLICTNETRFFREPRQFEFLDTEVLPRWKVEAGVGQRTKKVRAWSAACSTGEEPYSLGMLLRAHLRAEEGWAVDVLASDLSTRVLAAASNGVWPIERADDIPEPYRREFMLRGVRGESGRMRAHPQLRSLLEFQQINLIEDRYPIEGTFDLIFCRNVLIYFDRPTKAAVVDRLARHLSPGGLLFLGHSETLSATSSALRHAGPTVYARA
jgi:chemotaxis protein methyltransferase CheR